MCKMPLSFLFYVRSAKNIIGENAVEAGEDKQVFDGDSQHSTLVAGVYSLAGESHAALGNT